jgi:hypothetical protein
VEDFNTASEEDILAIKGVGAKMLETVSERIKEYLASIPEPPKKETNGEVVEEVGEADEVPVKETEDDIGDVELEEASN